MGKICNQAFVKDKYRIRRYAGTLKCICCQEESDIRFKTPFPLSDFTKVLKAFTRLHDVKGCNEVVMDAPEWASQSVEFGIIV